MSYQDSDYRPDPVKFRQSQIAIALLLVAYIGGCSFAAHGAAIFCTAGGDGIDWFTNAQSVLLLLTIPMLLIGLFWSRLRAIAMIVGILGLAGLAAQEVYLNLGMLHCDAP